MVQLAYLRTPRQLRPGSGSTSARSPLNTKARRRGRLVLVHEIALSLSPHKRLGTPAVQMTTFGAVKTAELFGQKLIDRILLFGF